MNRHLPIYFQMDRRRGKLSRKVLIGVNLRTFEDVAMKVESVDAEIPRINNEYEQQNKFQDPLVEGIPKIHAFGVIGDYNVIVMDLLGPSLDYLMNPRGQRFTITTVLVLAEPLIDRLKTLHMGNVIHWNISPENIVIGGRRGEASRKVYLINFAEAESLDHVHYSVSQNLPVNIWYASINAHGGIQQNRRDDMESLGYVLLYFWNGSLPWQSLRASNERQLNEQVLAMKLSTPYYKNTRLIL